MAARGTQRDDRSTRGRKKAEGEEEHVADDGLTAEVLDEVLGVVRNGLVAAAGTAARDGNIPGLIALHKHFARLRQRGRSRGAGRSVRAREELERFDHAFGKDQAE